MHHLIDTWNLIKSTAVVWGPFASALIAAFIVHILTQSREREKWILDCKKQEYRELLDALSNLFVKNMDAKGDYIGEEGKRLKEAAMHFTRIVWDRLYVTNDLPLKELEAEWYTAAKLFSKTHDYDDLLKAYTLISQRIVRAANRSVPKTTIRRLKFWKK